MPILKFLGCIILILFLGCKGDKKPSEGGSFADQAEEIESESKLSAACEKDLKKLGEFLDDAQEMAEKRMKGGDFTDADEEEWKKKSIDMAKEFTTSAGAYTDPGCALAVSQLQAEFSKVMMQMAQAQMQNQ